MKKFIDWAFFSKAICTTTCNLVGWMLIIMIHVICPEQISYPGYYYAVGIITFLTLSEILVYILEQKKADKKEKSHAHWIHYPETQDFKEHWTCSHCNHDIIENPRYTNRITGDPLNFDWCPYCGAMMDEEAADDRAEN